MQEVKKVVIIGPESTGKSTLCQQLAEHYETLWCPEFARDYLMKNGTNYTFDDLLLIAKGQLALEEEFLIKAIAKWQTSEKKIANPVLFEDTDMYVLKVWCEYVFGRSHSFIDEKSGIGGADLYLLCNVDLPWIKDELREYPDLESRQELYIIYKNILINQAVPWINISGNYEERFLTAVKATDALLGS